MIVTGDAWRDTVDAAQAHNAPCEFSTLIGYEWSGLAGAANLHRNVILRSRAVLPYPVSARHAGSPEALWDALDRQCRDGIPGCESITIPHNSNLSERCMFAPTLAGGEAMTDRVALQPCCEDSVPRSIQERAWSSPICYSSR